MKRSHGIQASGRCRKREAKLPQTSISGLVAYSVWKVLYVAVIPAVALFNYVKRPSVLTRFFSEIEEMFSLHAFSFFFSLPRGTGDQNYFGKRCVSTTLTTSTAFGTGTRQRELAASRFDAPPLNGGFYSLKSMTTNAWVLIVRRLVYSWNEKILRYIRFQFTLKDISLLFGATTDTLAATRHLKARCE